MWILFRQLCQKPADLDLQRFQKRINPGSAAFNSTVQKMGLTNCLDPVEMIHMVSRESKLESLIFTFFRRDKKTE